MKKVPVLMIVIFLLHSVTVETTDERRFNILKFGQTRDDYVMFQHDMSQFETGFTVCSWVRKLRNDQVPTWFSYAVSGENREIQISDMGDRTRIFGDSTNLASLYTVTPGTWFHNCLSWDSVTSTRDVYIDGVRVDSRRTPAGRTLIQGGTIVLGNEQESGPGAGMDTYNMFLGELYKLNMFTRKLSGSEIREMSEDRCSKVEMKYEGERGMKWEQILGQTKYGNVTESWSGCISPAAFEKVRSDLQDYKESLNRTLEELGRTQREKEVYQADLQEIEEQLNSTTMELEQAKSDLENKDEQLNSTYLELEQTKSDLENKEEQLNSTTLELEQTKSDLENKDEQLNSTTLELEQTKSDLENKEEQLNSTTLELEQTKSDLENKEEQLNSTTLKLEQTKSDLENKEEQLNSTYLELEQTKSDLENKARELNTTSQTLDLTQTELVKIRAELEKSANFTPLCSPNTTVTSHWDLLYSERFFGGVVTEEKLGVLRSSIQKLEYFVGVKVTDGIINFFKIFHDGEEEQCP